MLWPVADLQVAQIVIGCNELSVAGLTSRVEVRWRDVKHGSARLSYITSFQKSLKCLHAKGGICGHSRMVPEQHLLLFRVFTHFLLSLGFSKPPSTGVWWVLPLSWSLTCFLLVIDRVYSSWALLYPKPSQSEPFPRIFATWTGPEELFLFLLFFGMNLFRHKLELSMAIFHSLQKPGTGRIKSRYRETKMADAEQPGALSA